MKKLLLSLLFVVLLSSVALAAAPFHIGVITFTVSQFEDEVRGAEQLISEYGDVANGGMINHLTFPDNFMAEQETTISQIKGLADDPMMKAIILSEGAPGTVEAFRQVRERRPDILLITGYPYEDPVMVADVADFAVNDDSFSRGYLKVLVSQKLGADTFVFVSFPRHLSQELISRQRSIIIEACKDLGLKFVDISAQDPLSEVGVAGAQQFILEKVPSWIDQYGKNTAFFATNASFHEPLIKQITEYGGIYIASMMPSPTLGFPGALGIEFTELEKGSWPLILKKVEDKVVEIGAAGRLETWSCSFGFVMVAGLGEHAKRVIEGTSEVANKDDVLAAFGKYTPGSSWNSTYYVDANDVVRKNFLLVYQDSYILGKGYLDLPSVVIPAKYYDRNIGKN